MLIHVVRVDNRYDYVKDFILDILIESKEIVKFKRRTGWVTIGVDPIRRSHRDIPFHGPDRRETKIQ
ncbi:MAG: GSU3473 family protein [Syntrophales bacterium]